MGQAELIATARSFTLKMFATSCSQQPRILGLASPETRCLHWSSPMHIPRGGDRQHATRYTAGQSPVGAAATIAVRAARWDVGYLQSPLRHLGRKPGSFWPGSLT